LLGQKLNTFTLPASSSFNDAVWHWAAILHTIRDRLAQGDRVELRGFGTFASRKHAARLGCNPRTKAPVSVSEKVVPAFKAAKEMHQRLNPRSLPRRNRTAMPAANTVDAPCHIDA
jgi:integration host factor subunit beta